MENHKGFLRVSGSVVLLFMALGLAAAPAWAQTTVNTDWIDGDGNWTTAANWSCNCVPNNNSTNVFNVTVPEGDAAIHTGITVNSLSTGANGEVDSFFSSSTVTGNLTNDGTMETDFNLWTVDGTFANNGTLTLLAATVVNAPALTNGGSISIFPGSGIDVSGDLANAGGIEVQGGGTQSSNLDVGGNLLASGNITASGAPPGAGQVSVGGNLVVVSGGSVDVGGAGSVYVTGNATNAGSIELAGGSDDVQPGALSTTNFTNTGTVTMDPAIQGFPSYDGGSLGASGAYTQTAGSTEVNGTLGATSVVISGGKVSGSGTIDAVTYTQTAGSTDVDGTLIAHAVNIEGGTLSGSGTIKGNVVNDAIVSPGDPATLTINGGYTQKADGTLVIDIAGATDYSILDVSGEASLDGAVDFDFLNGYVPGANTDFAFLEAGSVAGDFSALDVMGINCPSCKFNLSTLSLDTGDTPPTFGSPVPEPGMLILFGTGLLGLVALLLKQRIRTDTAG